MSSGIGSNWLAIISIPIVLRLLMLGGASHAPKVRGDKKIYGVKWQLRLVLILYAAVCAALVFHFGKELDEWFVVFMAVILLWAALPIISGSVTVGADGIEVKWLWFRRSCRWGEVRELRFNQNDKQIDVIGGPQKLQLDWRFATSAILDELVSRTGMQPVLRNVRVDSKQT